MTADLEDPATLVIQGIGRRSAESRGVFLRQLLAHAAAGLAVLEGQREAVEVVYRLADAVVAHDVP